MPVKINESVSVNFSYNHLKNAVYPKAIFWRGKLYKITKVGLHHLFKEGRVLKHVFSVISDNAYFRLCLDTETLHWKLEEVYNDAS